MGMNGTLRAAISVLIAIVALKILEYCFPMDEIYLSFQSILPHLSLGTGWAATATGVLNMWVWYDRSPVIILIAVCVWFALHPFATVDYTKVRP
jgi:hypothetical protein